jgi:hypothetical protein
MIVENILPVLLSSSITLIIAYFAFKKEDKNNQLQHITEERRKWREKMRELIPEFLSYGLNKDGSPKKNRLRIGKIVPITF